MVFGFVYFGYANGERAAMVENGMIRKQQEFDTFDLATAFCDTLALPTAAYALWQDNETYKWIVAWYESEEQNVNT